MFIDNVMNKVHLYIKQFEFPKKELGVTIMSMDDVLYCLWTVLCTKFFIVCGRYYVQSFLLYLKQFEFYKLSVDDFVKITSIER